MGDFFKPWRRKIDVVTLLMACIFMAGWVRSMSIEDSMGVYLAQFRSGWFLSVNGFFAFYLHPEPQGTRFAVWNADPWSRTSFDSEGYIISPSGVRLGGRVDGDGNMIEPDTVVTPPTAYQLPPLTPLSQRSHPPVPNFTLAASLESPTIDSNENR